MKEKDILIESYHYRYARLSRLEPGKLMLPRNSMVDLDFDIQLKMSNYDDTVRKLDHYYGIGMLVNFVV